MRGLLAHRATHYREVDGPSEYGTPGDATLEVIGSFACRLTWTGGFETAADRTGQREQTRSGKIFAMYEDVELRRGDRVVVNAFGSHVFEIEFQRIIYGHSAPHHWECDVVYVDGT